MVGPRLYTTAGLSDRTPAWALHIIEYAAPAPLLQLFPYQSTKGETYFASGPLVPANPLAAHAPR